MIPTSDGVEHGASAAPTSRFRPTTRWVAVAVALAALLVAARSGAHLLPRLAARADALGAWGPVAFVTAYAVAVVALIPASILTLAAGAIFGLARGTVLTLIGAIAGSAAAFLVARYGARSLIEQRLARDARFQAIDRGIGERGLLIVLLLRLSPVFPFSLLNYALGLTRVRFAHYLIASVGMIPGTLLYVYSGAVAGDVATVASGATIEGGPGRWIVTAAGLIATLAATAVVTRVARTALAERIPPPADDGADASGRAKR